MSRKMRWNHIVNVTIALLGLLSAVSGFLLLTADEGGYRGGRNLGFQAVILGLSRHTWSDLHVWFSLLAVAGVVLHLALHWKWIVCATKAWFPAKPRREVAVETCPVE